MTLAISNVTLRLLNASAPRLMPKVLGLQKVRCRTCCSRMAREIQTRLADAVPEGHSLAQGSHTHGSGRSWCSASRRTCGPRQCPRSSAASSKRLFGAPPADEAQRVRTSLGLADPVATHGFSSVIALRQSSFPLREEAAQFDSLPVQFTLHKGRSSSCTRSLLAAAPTGTTTSCPTFCQFVTDSVTDAESDLRGV